MAPNEDKGIFEATGDGTQSYFGPGRPIKHTGHTQTISVVFDDATADRLRMECIKMKKENGSKFSLNEFIRPVVEAALESDIDLSQADNEAELKELFLSHLERGQNVLEGT